MMDAAKVCQVDDKTLQISGMLNHNTVLALQQPLHRFMTSMSIIHIQLTHVAFSDSSGLALLVECLRTAKKQHKTIVYYDMPQQMQAMARVMGLMNIFPIQASESHG